MSCDLSCAFTGHLNTCSPHKPKPWLSKLQSPPVLSLCSITLSTGIILAHHFDTLHLISSSIRLIWSQCQSQTHLPRRCSPTLCTSFQTREAPRARVFCWSWHRHQRSTTSPNPAVASRWTSWASSSSLPPWVRSTLWCDNLTVMIHTQCCAQIKHCRAHL